MKTIYTIYPMSMVHEIVGTDEKIQRVSHETCGFDFNYNDPYFVYTEGEYLESILEGVAQELIGEGHHKMYGD